MRNWGQGSVHSPTLPRQSYRNLGGGPFSCGQSVCLYEEGKDYVNFPL